MSRGKHDKQMFTAGESGGGTGGNGVYGMKEKKSLKQKIKDMKTWKKVLLLVVLVLLLAALIVGMVVYSYMGSLVDEMHEATPEDYDLSLTEVDGYINILLLGVDSRDMDNIKGTRSDMIMIASINTETYDVKLTSVFRDTYLKLGDTSTYDKITHACVYGGPEMTMKSLNQAMDLNISNYIVVNFKTVADVVDAVGGITVDVQDYEIQQLNKYTKQTANNIGKTDYNLVTSAGEQTLEGVQAVSYGRIRKGVGDDFKRTERMRTVVMKVLDKVKTMSFSEIKEIIDMAVPQVQTNLDMNNILALGIRLPKYSISSGAGWPYKYSTGTINGVSDVFTGGSLAQNTTEFHQEVFGQTDYTPSSTVTTISNEINARISSARAANEIKGEKEGEATKDVIETDDTEITDNTGDGTDTTDPNGTGKVTDPDGTGGDTGEVIDDPDDPNYNPGGNSGNQGTTDNTGGSTGGDTSGSGSSESGSGDSGSSGSGEAASGGTNQQGT